jgi:protein-S-isoprenylcysteine O-methyltransferase Ste14
VSLISESISRSQGAAGPTRVAAALDWGERVALLLLYGWLAFRMVADYLSHGGTASLILLPSEGLVVLLVLIRRRTDNISQRPADWGMALAATMAPLLVQPVVGRSVLTPTMTAVLMLSGILVQLQAKFVLGRSFGCVAANRGLKFAGPYRYVRHPIYTGYLLTHVGFLLANMTGWNVAIYGICYVIQVPRLLAEEELLGHDLRYREYMSAVRYRLVPGVF